MAMAAAAKAAKAAFMAAMVSQQPAPRRTYRMTGTGRSGWGLGMGWAGQGQLGMAQTLSGWWFGIIIFISWDYIPIIVVNDG